MADARIPERYLSDRRVVRLSAEARAGLFMATVWSVSNRTDGRIECADLAFIPTFSPKIVPELLSADLWTPDGVDAWIIADYGRDQTSRSEFEVLDNARRADREKKRRLRAAKKSVSPGLSPGLVPGTAQARPGKARQEPGKDESEAEELLVDEQTGEISWPTAVPGEPDLWESPDAPGVVTRGAK